MATDQAVMDSLRELAAQRLAAVAEDALPGRGQWLAENAGISKAAGKEIIEQMRRDQARCAINSWEEAPDDLEARHLERLSSGDVTRPAASDYGVALIEEMIQRGYSDDDLQAITARAEAKYRTCIAEAQRLYTERLERAMGQR